MKSKSLGDNSGVRIMQIKSRIVNLPASKKDCEISRCDLEKRIETSLMETFSAHRKTVFKFDIEVKQISTLYII